MARVTTVADYVPTWFAVLIMALGTLGVLRSALLVATGSAGWYRGETWVSIAVGFPLIYLGQYLLR